MDKSRTRQRREIKQSVNRSRSTMAIIVAAVTVVAIGVIIFFVNRSQLPDVDLGEVADGSITFPLQGQEHIPEGSPRPDYNSNPPTSGPHYASPIRAGVYQQTPPDENLVHNLEHGHIWLSYRDADDSEAIQTLTAIQEQFPRWVVVTYRPDNDDRIAAAAWGRVLPLDEPDAEQILAFVMRYRDQAPESIPG